MVGKETGRGAVMPGDSHGKANCGHDLAFCNEPIE
ncbi:MAG: hypothetical protein JWP78_2502 [Mucilaginibacter sp.]|nr:hypothetical protein [Mucilaginibacter sp.]